MKTKINKITIYFDVWSKEIGPEMPTDLFEFEVEDGQFLVVTSLQTDVPMGAEPKLKTYRFSLDRIAGYATE